MGGGNGSETESVMEEEKIEDQYQCQPHPGLQGYRAEQQHVYTLSNMFCSNLFGYSNDFY